jgi:RNA-directed DNA polymerase
MRAKLRQIKPELHKRMHDPVAQTGQWLQSVVRGHFNYYAVPGNNASLSLFRHRVPVVPRKRYPYRDQPVCADGEVLMGWLSCRTCTDLRG